MKPETTEEVPEFENRWALFLDVDGTLLDFADDPERVRADRELRDLLSNLVTWNKGATVLVSGRSIASIDSVFDPLRLPVAGLHGHERRDVGGRLTRTSVEPLPRPILETRFEAIVSRHRGAFVEEKAPAYALHYRSAPEAADDVEALASELQERLPPTYRVQMGKMVLEVRPRAESKASAIEAFMREPGFERRLPVFLGDDATDEDGFRWVNASGGISVKVGPGDTRARHRFADPEAVRAWLEDYLHFLRESEESEHAS